MSANTRWWTAWITGVLMMLAVALIYQAMHNEPVLVTNLGSIHAQLPATIEFTIIFPTVDPTRTPTPRPTRKPTATIVDEWCSASPVSGQACRLPLPTQPPPTPYPFCGDLLKTPESDGAWCIWPEDVS